MILDVDGTLVDSNDAHAHAWVAAFASAGITVAFDRVRRAIGMGGDKLMPAVSGVAIASSAKEDELRPLLEIAGVADLLKRYDASVFARLTCPEPVEGGS